MKIAVWYHCKMSGSGIPDPEAAICILSEQMTALKNSGLAQAADEIHIGVNGGDSDGILVSAFAPDKSHLHIHGPNTQWEYHTLYELQHWLSPGWAVLYHHIKGVTNPNDEFHHHHRRTMEHYLVDNWKKCVDDLRRGYEAVGINLVDPVLRPVFGNNSRFFAGNFWWARSEWLMILPAINPNETNRMHAEGWVCNSKIRPMTMDYERPSMSDWCVNLLKPVL